jgi:SAM-dependent methyltransferase
MTTKPILKSSLGTVDYYDSHAQEYFKTTVNLDLRELYERFLKELSPGANILDAGCGSGRDTKAFLNRGYRVTSIEASPELARLATVFTAHSCGILLFQDMDFREEFDGIWACASLLHVPKHETKDVLFRFIQALKPGGIFYVSLKEGDAERVAADGRFFSDYTAESFRNIIAPFHQLRELAFWRTEEIRSRTHPQPWLNFLLKKIELLTT